MLYNNKYNNIIYFNSIGKGTSEVDRAMLLGLEMAYGKINAM